MHVMHVMHIENFSRCLTQSMSLAGNCYDNAFVENLCIESLRATLKTLVHNQRIRIHGSLI